MKELCNSLSILRAFNEI